MKLVNIRKNRIPPFLLELVCYRLCEIRSEPLSVGDGIRPSAAGTTGEGIWSQSVRLSGLYGDYQSYIMYMTLARKNNSLLGLARC